MLNMVSLIRQSAAIDPKYNEVTYYRQDRKIINLGALRLPYKTENRIIMRHVIMRLNAYEVGYNRHHFGHHDMAVLY